MHPFPPARRGLARRPRRAVAVVFAVVLTAAAAPAAAQDGLVGRTLEHTFERAPFRSSGLARLEDLRGAPVWIEFWSTTATASYAITVPTAVKLQDKHGDDLQVLCVELGGASHDEMARFVLRYRWAEERVMWTTEPPGGGVASVPFAVVLAPDGEVLAAGNSLEDAKPLTDALQDALATRRKGPKGTPSAVGKAWSEFAKGRLGRALTVAREAAAKARGKKPETAVAAQLAEAAIAAAAEARLARAGGMLSSGHYGDARAWLEELAEAVEGDEALAARVAELAATLEGEEAAAELEADAALSKLERKLYAKGPDDDLADDLLDLAREVSGTKAAERARELAALARED